MCLIGAACVVAASELLDVACTRGRSARASSRTWTRRSLGLRYVTAHFGLNLAHLDNLVVCKPSLQSSALGPNGAWFGVRTRAAQFVANHRCASNMFTAPIVFAGLRSTCRYILLLFGETHPSGQNVQSCQ
eukprot:530764-Prorocentrum_minimum.AAC.1